MTITTAKLDDENVNLNKLCVETIGAYVADLIIYWTDILNPVNDQWKIVYIGGEDDAIFDIKNCDSSYIPLASSSIGDRCTITEIRLSKELKQSLGKLGLIIGVDVEVISQTFSGSVVVQTHNNKIKVGLGAALAKKVFVISTK